MTETASTLRQSLDRLDVQRKSLELEGETIISELTAVPESGGSPMGIDTPLVDPEGYPRGDVDVYRARDLRKRLAVIKTDRQVLMTQIDALLKQLAVVQNPNKPEEEKKEMEARSAPKPKPKFDAKSGKWVVMNWDGTVAGVEDGENRSFENLSGNTIPTNSVERMSIDNATSTHSTTTITATLPFAKIDAVALLSPAAEAGLQAGDLITAFGSINHDNNQTLLGLMPIVTSAADSQQAIAITLLRQTDQSASANKQQVQLALVPKPWPGRGLIGCHIIPYSETA